MSLSKSVLYFLIYVTTLKTWPTSFEKILRSFSQKRERFFEKNLWCLGFTVIYILYWQWTKFIKNIIYQCKWLVQPKVGNSKTISPTGPVIL